MKHLKNLNLGISLNRNEMKNIMAGSHAYLDDGSACPDSTCSTNAECGKDSYCANTGCTISEGYHSSFNSCQWKK